MNLYRRYIRTNITQQKGEPSEIIGTHGSYGHLLFDQRWKDKRILILERDQNKCVICNQSENLQVHHRQYHFLKTVRKFKAPWDYSNDLLLTLCNSCHQRGHSKFKVPIISI